MSVHGILWQIPKIVFTLLSIQSPAAFILRALPLVTVTVPMYLW